MAFALVANGEDQKAEQVFSALLAKPGNAPELAAITRIPGPLSRPIHRGQGRREGPAVLQKALSAAVIALSSYNLRLSTDSAHLRGDPELDHLMGPGKHVQSAGLVGSRDKDTRFVVAAKQEEIPCLS